MFLFEVESTMSRKEAIMNTYYQMAHLLKSQGDC